MVCGAGFLACPSGRLESLPHNIEKIRKLRVSSDHTKGAYDERKDTEYGEAPQWTLALAAMDN